MEGKYGLKIGWQGQIYQKSITKGKYDPFLKVQGQI